MRSDRTSITVVSGNTSPVARTPIGRLAARILPHPVMKRLSPIRWIFASIVFAGVLGAVLLCLDVASTYQAASVAKLPVPFKLSSAKLRYFGIGLLERRGV